MEELIDWEVESIGVPITPPLHHSITPPLHLHSPLAMAFGVSELLLLGLLGLACVGAIVAGIVVALSASRRGEDSPRDVMHCPHCRTAVSPLDRYCPSCGQPLKPQEIEKLDPDAR
jgi:hypothetical protein